MAVVILISRIAQVRKLDRVAAQKCAWPCLKKSSFGQFKGSRGVPSLLQWRLENYANLTTSVARARVCVCGCLRTFVYTRARARVCANVISPSGRYIQRRDKYSARRAPEVRATICNAARGALESCPLNGNMIWFQFFW